MKTITNPKTPAKITARFTARAAFISIRIMGILALGCLALTFGAVTASAETTINVGGAGTIGTNTLTTSGGIATLPATGDTWKAKGGNGNTYSYLDSPSLTVLSNGVVTLTFTHRWNFEEGFDGGAVYVAINGVTNKVLLGDFSSNGYNTNFSSTVWIAEDVFGGQSAGWGTPSLITSVASLGTLTAGDTVQVEFRGGWDANTFPAAPNWEIGTVQVSDPSATLLNVDFNAAGTSGFTATADGTASSPWTYLTPIFKFEINGDTLAADRYKPDIAGSVIDLNNARIQVVRLTGTLDVADTFSLFDLSGGTTLSNSIASLSLPGGVAWNTNSLATAGTITVSAITAANGTWTNIAASGNNWSATNNWTNGIVADFSDKTAFFTANITNTTTITNDTSRTIGNITFTDSTTSSHDLTLSGANTLTLEVTTNKPVIDVTQSSRQLSVNCVITGTNGFQKNGLGVLNLGGANTYTGTTVANAGILSFGSINLDGFGGGVGVRDITVAAGAVVRRNTLDNAFLNRLVETNTEFGVFTGTTANSFDFSSSTGANLPKAFLGNWAGNGAKAEHSGTITPASDAYRLGGTGSSGLLGIVGANKLTGTQGLIVGGTGASSIRVELAAAQDFTGDTVINTGAKLTLGNNLALQNSALDLGSAGGTFALHTTFAAGHITGATASPSPTFGGLKGSRNLLAAFSSTGGNNEALLAATAVTGFTLNVGAGKTCTYSGVITNFAAGTTLTLGGSGTQVFSGKNLYSGATTISAGTLIGVTGGSSSNSAVTVNPSSSGTLGVLVSDNTKQWTCASLTTAGTGPNLAFGFATTPSPTVAPLNITGDLTFTTTPGIVLDVANLTVGATYPLIVVVGTAPTGITPAVTFTGAGTLAATTAWVGNTLNVTINSGTSYEPLSWSASGSGTWDINTTANWSNSVPALVNYQENIVGDQVQFTDTGIAADTTVTLNTPVKPGSVTVSNSTYNYTISGSGGIGGGTGLAKSGTQTLSLGTANSYTGNTTISGGTLNLTNSGTLGNGSYAGAVSIAASSALSIGSTADQTLSGTISGNGTLTKAASGILTISGTNNYTGTTYVNTGTLRIASPTALGGTAGGTIVSSGATLNSLTTMTNSGESLTLSGKGTTGANGALNVGGNKTLTWDGLVTLAADTMIHADGGSAFVFTTNASVNLGAFALTLDNGNSTASSLAGNISGVGGSILKTLGTAVTITLSGSNTYTGPTTISAGTLTIGGAGQLGGGNYGGNITNNGVALIYASSANQTLGGVISGSGALTKSTSATSILTLTNVNTYTNTTTITAGVLLLNNANALPGGISTAGGTGALTINGGVLGLGAGNFTRNVGASGAVGAYFFNNNGGWAAYGADRLVNINGAGATFTWSSAFNGKSLILGAATATHKVTLVNPLNLNGASRIVQVDNGAAPVDAEFSEVISDTTGNALTKTGTGTLALSGPNTYSGGTTNSAGTLLVNNLTGSGTGSGAVTVLTNATLGGTGTIGGSVVVNNGGNLAPGASPGTLTIGGNLVVSNQAAGTTGKLYFELGSLAGPNDLVVVTNTLTIGSGLLGFSDFVFTNVGGLQNGTYPLITSGAAVSGTLDGANLSGAIGAGTGTLQISGSGTDIELVVSGIGGGASTNAYLTSLALSPLGTLTPSFSSNTLAYSATNAYVNTPITVTVTNADLTATNTLITNGVSAGLLASGTPSTGIPLTLGAANLIQVLVMAQDGLTTNLYTVNVTLQPSLTPPTLTKSASGGVLSLSWPADHLGYTLQVKTNPASAGLNGGTWDAVVGSSSVTSTNLPINNAPGTTFFRLVYP